MKADHEFFQCTDQGLRDNIKSALQQFPDVDSNSTKIFEYSPQNKMLIVCFALLKVAFIKTFVFSNPLSYQRSFYALCIRQENWCEIQEYENFIYQVRYK